jgi:eukaryotic-like serine/threonine-protein kinase
LRQRYRLDEHIAVGGMGEVWQGTDLALNRKVAVKLLRPEHANDQDLLWRFRAEARLAGLLSHPNIAQVFDFRDAAPPDPAYLVMEYVDGPSLAGLLHDGPLDPARTMDIVAQAARGLAAAHRAGLVHRDVKPGNLLARHDGVIKVSDFGIARAEAATPVTRTGQLPGTPGYMAPERSAGASATPASDLYSLGVVAHQCLTGRPPFKGDALAVAIAHMERQMPPLPPSVPAQVAALVAELTSKDPQSRPPSAEEVAERAGRIMAFLAAAGNGTAPLPAVAKSLPPIAEPLPTAAESLPPIAEPLPAGPPQAPASLPQAAAQTLPTVAPTLLDQPSAGTSAGAVRLLQPRTWARLSVPRLPARAGVAALAALALLAIGMAGFIGWMLGARPSTPAAGPPHGPHASLRPSAGAPAVGQIPGTGTAATPATTPSARSSASETPSPRPSPSASPTPSASATPSPSLSSSPSPTPPPPATTPHPGP